MTQLKDLLREYEKARYPADRRLDLQAEGPQSGRERALHWIQSRAHEGPGEDLLLIVSRGGRPGRAPTALEGAIRSLLDELQGRLIEWWHPFAPGSLAVRLAAEPSMAPRVPGIVRKAGEGRTPETAGSARPDLRRDIPPELLELATRLAERRIDRETLSIRLLDVVLREVWLEAQALAMERRIGFDAALTALLDEETAAYD